MDYNDCAKIIAATSHLFDGTKYGADYYLDAEIYFTLDGEWIYYYELPDSIKVPFNEIIETLEINF